MRAYDRARVAVAVGTRLLGSLGFLAAGPGARSRGWRLRFRVVATGVAAVLVTAGLAAAPARAASVTPAGSAASVTRAGGAVSVPGLGDAAGAARRLAAMTTAATALPSSVTASFDFTSYDVAEMTAVIDHWWPAMFGVADGSRLDSLVALTWNNYQKLNPPSDWILPPEPTDLLSGTTISITSDGGTGASSPSPLPRRRARAPPRRGAMSIRPSRPGRPS